MTGDVPYGTGAVRGGGEVDLLLDLYEPVAGPSPRPVAIIVHGGGFVGGDKAGGVHGRVAEELAARGFVAVSINYRLAPDDPAIDPDLEVLLDHVDPGGTTAPDDLRSPVPVDRGRRRRHPLG